MKKSEIYDFALFIPPHERKNYIKVILTILRVEAKDKTNNAILKSITLRESTAQ